MANFHSRLSQKSAPHVRVGLFLSCLWLVVSHYVFANDTETVYYSTDEFEVTEFDRQMYLRNAPQTGDETVGSRARNLQALSDLYAMKILLSDASGLELLSEAEIQWFAAEAVALETLKRYIQVEVERRLQNTDLDLEAKEFYLANPEKFQLPEAVTIRTLLIRATDRSMDEALQLAEELAAKARRPGADFAELVRENTEDENARVAGGLMKNVQRGDTVAPFEKAAFDLREQGEFSEPVVSEYGVHLIQLVEYRPPQKRTFEQERLAIIEELRVKRAGQYREAIHLEARERKPVGFQENTEALDALMKQTSDGFLGRE